MSGSDERAFRWLWFPRIGPAGRLRSRLACLPLFTEGGYYRLRMFLGLLLLTAAALKARQVVTEPVLGPGLLTTWWFIATVVEFEVFFGLWLLVGPYPRATWLAALGGFTAFAGASLYKIIEGATTCGCFGSVATSPGFTLGLDCAILGALVVFRPQLGVASGERRCASFRAACTVLVAWAALGVPIAVVLASSRSTEQGLIATKRGDLVVIEPSAWIGKRFQLLSDVDIGDDLAKGAWLVLMHRHDCPSCTDAIPRFQMLASRLDRSEGERRFAVVEVPPYDTAGILVRLGASVRAGRLRDTSNWFVGTPVLIRLQDGVVVRITDRSGVARELQGGIACELDEPDGRRG